MIQETLEGGCYVLHMEDADRAQKSGQQTLETISPGKGAKALLQQVLRIGAGASFNAVSEHAETVIFFVKGHGQIKIGGKCFDFSPNTACFVGDGETIEIMPAAGPVKAVMTACLAGSEGRAKKKPAVFNSAFPVRTRSIDPELREAMGDRFFQVMVDREMGSRQVTCFIGEIPKSKAPSHFHLYEEALYVLSGEGRMWTGEMSAPVQAGDIIYLPRKQVHSLECTSDTGLRVCGVFYPAGSPAENY